MAGKTSQPQHRTLDTMDPARTQKSGVQLYIPPARPRTRILPRRTPCLSMLSLACCLRMLIGFHKTFCDSVLRVLHLSIEERSTVFSSSTLRRMRFGALMWHYGLLGFYVSLILHGVGPGFGHSRSAFMFAFLLFAFYSFLGLGFSFNVQLTSFSKFPYLSICWGRKVVCTGGRGA